VYQQSYEVNTMNFGDIGSMGGAVASYIATPEGQDAVKKFLASPEGIALLKDFAGTAAGQNTMLSILPTVLGGLNLPAGATDMIKSALPPQQ
jgi:hypothetical protein